MDILTKLKSSISDLSKLSADAARDGVEKISEKSTEFIELNKVKMERKAIEKKIDDTFAELGGKFYNLYSTKKLRKSAAEFDEFAEQVKNLKNQLYEKDEEINAMYGRLSPETLEAEKVRSLREALANGGGTLEQMRVAADSPAAGKKLRNLKLPKQVLVGAVVRGEELFIPDGTFSLQDGDEITLLGKRAEVEAAAQVLSAAKEKKS